MQMGVSGDNLRNPKIALLPIEEQREIGGVPKMVKCEYIAQITSMTEIDVKSKPGKKQAKLTVAVERPDGILYLDDYLSYEKPGVQKLADLMTILNIPFEGADTDAFIGQYIVINIKHETYNEEKYNRLDKYVRVPTKEELLAAGLEPF